MAVYQLNGRLQSVENIVNNWFVSSTSIVARCFHAFSSEDMFIFYYFFSITIC